jgi:hypothetical protein
LYVIEREMQETSHERNEQPLQEATISRRKEKRIVQKMRIYGAAAHEPVGQA